jgi:hypothetical protein
MHKIQLIIILFLTIGCGGQGGYKLNDNTQIIAKYQTLDEIRSPNHSKCSDIVMDFKKMGEYDCSFKVDKYEFDIEKKFVLDKNGNVKEYWTYLAEGPLTYNIQELKSDEKFLESIGGSELNITFLKDGIHILDKGDTLEIEKIFPEQKLILIKQSEEMEKDGRRLLFEYK